MSSEPSTFKTVPKPFEKSFPIPSSKSYANRLLVLAALSPNPVYVRNLPLSSDVSTMLECFKVIGLHCERDGNDVLIQNSFPQCEYGEDRVVLQTGDGGTTNRFLLPLLALGKREYELRAKGHMRKRPMEDLIKALTSCGANLSYNPSDDDNEPWITIKGPVLDENKKEVEIDCSQTTQFLTGLALAFSRTNISVIPKNLSVSLPYWNLTKNLLEIAKEEPQEFENPVDFSSISYPLALAALIGRVCITNCYSIDQNQADSQFIDLLKEMGAKVEFKKEGLVVEKGELTGIDFNGSQCPDVIPTLIFVCSFAQGKSTLTHLEVLTHKECDRYEEMVRLLKAAGIEHTANRNDYSLEIIGKGLPESQVPLDFDPVADHRMVMVTYLFQRLLGGGVILDNAHHVKKSFANFFEVMS